VRGVNASAAVAHIKERAARGQGPGSATDGRKLGLILEGGAMRGIISAGGVLALEELGMTGVFDEVYGASAGAVNASYFLAGQAAYGITIYYQDINNRHFISLGRLRKIVDIDYLFDTVIPERKPLRVKDVLASPSRLFVSITDAGTGEGLLVNAQNSEVPLLTLLKASTALPVLYNRPVKVAGRDCFDGGLTNPLPIQDAIDSGCTDLLVLLTRPAGYVEGAPRPFERWLFEKVCARGNTPLLGAFLNLHNRANAARDLALGRRRPAVPVNIATVCPDDEGPGIGRTTKRGDRLKAAAAESARRTLRAFGSDRERLVEVFRPFPK